MSIIDDVTVEDFKSFFVRFSPEYLPVWVEGTTYFLNDIVYYNSLFYKCIVESTTAEPTDDTSWTVTADSVLNYTQDSDIENAFLEASVNYNEGLFSDDDVKKLLFLYLTAHYLTIDFRNALGGNNLGILTSKHVGSISVGYTVPVWMTQSAALSAYATTGYGVKYASLIRPYLIGNVWIIRGRTTSV